VDSEGGVEMVEETRDVEEEDSPHAASLNGLLSFVTEGSSSIRGGMVCVRTKLTRSQEIKVVYIGAEMGGNHLLKKLPTALKEGDWLVGLHSSVVWFMWFGYNDDGGSGPGVGAQLQGLPQDQCEVVRARRKAPFKEDVWDARRTWGRLIRHAREGGGNLRTSDQVKRSGGGKAGEARQRGESKGGEVKESHFENACHGCWVRCDGGAIGDGGNGRAAATVS